jgi:hypothetical protein
MYGFLDKSMIARQKGLGSVNDRFCVLLRAQNEAVCPRSIADRFKKSHCLGGTQISHRLMTDFWSWRLIFAVILNCVVVCLTIGAYAARLAGARSGRVATAISLFNLFSTAGRLAAMIYLPILGALADKAGFAAHQGAAEHAVVVNRFLWQLRLIVFAGGGGALLGTVLLPTFVMFYLRAITSFERLESIPKAALRVLSPAKILGLARAMRVARPSSLLRLPLRYVPKDVLLLNTLITAVYGIGVTAATYASVLDPTAARTALLSSGLINGLATIAYNIVVDPASALMTDRTVRGERSIRDVKALVAYLSLTAIAGYFVSQLLLIPAAWLLVRTSTLITGR